MEDPVPSASPLNPPRQSRSKRTLERIVRASLDILDEDGPSGLTVQAIVARADSSVGSFYARFGGKDDLLDYLGDRVWHEALDRWEHELESRDWSEPEFRALVQGAVGLLVDAHRSRTGYLKALDRVAGSADDAYARFVGQLVSGLTGVLLSRDDDIAHLNPPLAVRLGLGAVIGMIDGDQAPGGEPLPRATLITEATDLLVGYLSPGAAGTASGEVEFFDIWG